MKLIRQNPYRIIGVLAGAGQKEIAKQKSKIKALQKVGRDITFDTDLDFIRAPERSEDALEEAFSRIEINRDKLFYSLFWFTSMNHLDETALSYLKSGDKNKAEEIWHKVTDGKEVSAKNFSAFSNLSSLKLAKSLGNGSIDYGALKEGIRLKTELFFSESFKDFCHFVADETYTVDPNQELELFVHSLLEESTEKQASASSQLPAVIADIHPRLQSIVAEKLVDGPFHAIEQKIKQTKEKRNENVEEGLTLGKLLYEKTKDDLNTLTKLLGTTDLKYKMIADKLAKELLQCGVDYFKAYQNREEEHQSRVMTQRQVPYGSNGTESRDLGVAVMSLLKLARSTAQGNQTLERVAENINGLKEWIEGADERAKQKLVEGDLQFILEKLARFGQMRDSIDNANGLITNCQPKLQNMKSVLGAGDELYLKISSTIVNQAQGMLVAAVNKAQEAPIVHSQQLEDLRIMISKATRVSKKLGEFDMLPQLRTHHNKNHQTLQSINSQLRNATGSTTSSDGEGMPNIIRWIGWIVLIFILIKACE